MVIVPVDVVQVGSTIAVVGAGGAFGATPTFTFIVVLQPAAFCTLIECDPLATPLHPLAG